MKFCAKVRYFFHFSEILSFFYLFISKKGCNFASVIELERHIEILLLSNDCVIVPRLGGFMAHNIEARYDEHEQMFLPPLRTLGFNPQLNINDSLLVQSYIEAYDISYPEALQRIEDEVEELKQHLQNEGSYELNDIGVLALNDDGNYVFTPCEAGILTPCLYGLSSVEMARLSAPQPQLQPAVSGTAETAEETAEARIVGIDSLTPESKLTDEEESFEEEDDTDIIRIRYTWVRNSVAVAAILLAVFILALPTGKTDMMQRTISNFNNGLFFGMTSKDTNTSRIEIVSKSDVSRKVESEGLKENTLKADSLSKATTTANADTASSNLTPPSTLRTPRKEYSIVLASYVSVRNANSFIERLQKQGFEQAEIFERNNIRRVIYGHYPTEEAARDDIRRFHRQSETAEAWIMQL